MAPANSQSNAVKEAEIPVLEENYLKHLDEIFALMPKTLKPEDHRLIEKAFHYAFEAHKGRQRYSKEPYIVH